MRISHFPAGELATNCYIVASENSSDCIIIDPGQDAEEEACRRIAEHDLHPIAIMLTHGHADHIWNAPQLSDTFDIPVYAHPGDHFMVEDPLAGVGPLLGSIFPPFRWVSPTRLQAYPSDTMTCADLTIEVLHTPGHTPGSVCLLVKEEASSTTVMFSGDTLFKGAVGRTDLPGGSAEQLRSSLEEVIVPLPLSIVVAPGHGPSSTMEEERAQNVFLARYRQR